MLIFKTSQINLGNTYEKITKCKVKKNYADLRKVLGILKFWVYNEITRKSSEIY